MLHQTVVRYQVLERWRVFGCYRVSRKSCLTMYSEALGFPEIWLYHI